MNESVHTPFTYTFTIGDGSSEKVTVSLLENGFLKITDTGKDFTLTHTVEYRDGKWMRVEGSSTAKPNARVRLI